VCYPDPDLQFLKGALPMLRTLTVISLLPLLLLTTPASALTAKQKMETCKAGADSQQLKAAKRTDFIKRCMAKGNYEPPARKTAAKKPAPSSAPPADDSEEEPKQ
jgi:hypothetical protein